MKKLPDEGVVPSGDRPIAVGENSHDRNRETDTKLLIHVKEQKNTLE